VAALKNINHTDMKHDPKEKPEPEPSRLNPEVPLIHEPEPLITPPETEPAPDTIPSPEPDQE
jgi:hypothetical protein